MPVILDPARYSAWLDPATSTDELQAWLTAWPPEDMAMVPANPYVNSARNEGPECIEATAG
jgi:putative SOS response-associated peptidase YedK